MECTERHMECAATVAPGEVAQELSAVLVSHVVVATEAIAWSKQIEKTALFDACLMPFRCAFEIS